MSLDVYLRIPGSKNARYQSGIFIREKGQTKEISRSEWDRRNPGREPVVVQPEIEATDIVYSGNITHNLGKMADAVDLYDPLWRPNDLGLERAHQLIDPLQRGLFRLCSDPERYKQHAPKNGWGSYEGLVAFVNEYLAACKQYPEAEVSVWR